MSCLENILEKNDKTEKLIKHIDQTRFSAHTKSKKLYKPFRADYYLSQTLFGVCQ